MIPSALSIITTTFEEGVERNKALGIWALGGLGFVLTLYAQQVLGYSAVRFGLTSLVFPVMAALGSVLGQSFVLRVGFRPVAAVGMALMGGGALLLTQVAVGGGYFGDTLSCLLV